MTLSLLQTIGIAMPVVHAFREEHRPAADAAQAQSPMSTSSSAGASQIDEERLRAILREELAQEHIRLELQTDIAQLDAASRRQMLSKFTRALNTGEIKGRL